MYNPIDAFSQKVFEICLKSFDNDKWKAEFSKRVQIEMDAAKNKSGTSIMNYDSLTRGNVNLQARLAASGYSTYGSVSLSENQSHANENMLKRMRNKINYSAPVNGQINRGSTSRH